MAFDLSFVLTDRIRAATGGAEWDAYVEHREFELLSRERYRLTVSVRTCFPFESYGPPENLTFPWEGDPAAMLLGMKCRVRLVYAWGWLRPFVPYFSFIDDPTHAMYFPWHENRVIVEGDWELVPFAPEADIPVIVTS